MLYHVTSLTRLTPFFLRASPPTYRPAPSLPHNILIDLLPFTTKLPSSSGHANRPSPSFHVTHGSLQVGHRPRAHLCWEGLLLYKNHQSLVSYDSSTSFSFRPRALYSRIHSFTIPLSPFWTQHLLHPRPLHTHRRALDYDSVNLTSFRTRTP
jgi:hypothetical protein